MRVLKIVFFKLHNARTQKYQLEFNLRHFKMNNILFIHLSDHHILTGLRWN